MVSLPKQLSNGESIRMRDVLSKDEAKYIRSTDKAMEVLSHLRIKAENILSHLQIKAENILSHIWIKAEDIISIYG